MVSGNSCISPNMARSSLTAGPGSIAALHLIRVRVHLDGPEVPVRAAEEVADRAVVAGLGVAGERQVGAVEGMVVEHGAVTARAGHGGDVAPVGIGPPV